MGKRPIISFELKDEDLAMALAQLPPHMTKSGVIRMALRAYFGREQEQFSITLDEGDVQRVATDEELDGFLDNALDSFGGEIEF